MKKMLLLLTFLSFSILSIGQESLAREAYQKGEHALLSKKNRAALRHFKKALDFDEDYIPAWRGAGVSHDLLKEYALALSCYMNILSRNPFYSRTLYYEVARLYYRLGEYESALDFFRKFEALQARPPQSFGIITNQEVAIEHKYLEKLPRDILACKVSVDSIHYLNIAEVSNLGAAVNSKSDEYFPFVSNDDQLLFYTKRKNEKQDEDLFCSTAKKEIWTTGQSIGSFNTGKNEGMSTFIRNGRKMYFTACNRAEVQGTCDLWEAEVVGRKVEKVTTLQAAPNSEFWDSQASISCDGSAIYFASNRPGGLGGTDIWTSQLQKDGTWSSPKNMGPSINTDGDEEAPFMTSDGKVLYFSSTGHIGMGEQDIFFTRLSDDGKWSPARNLGPPVNSAARELGFFLSADGNVGYFASDREGGFGGMDIYTFRLPAQLYTEPMTFVEGYVKDEFGLPVVTKVRTPGRNFETDLEGRFFVCFPANERLRTRIEQTGFKLYDQTWDIPFSDNRDLHRLDIQLQTGVVPLAEKNKDVPPVKINPSALGVSIGRVYTHNLYYDNNTSKLNSANRNSLERFFAKFDPEKIIKIEIVGYADYVGDGNYNMK
ncbi:MAG: hypothetical protein AAF738_07000, partial [Bacteroidota bacterium]